MDGKRLTGDIIGPGLETLRLMLDAIPATDAGTRLVIEVADECEAPDAGDCGNDDAPADLGAVAEDRIGIAADGESS